MNWTQGSCCMYILTGRLNVGLNILGFKYLASLDLSIVFDYKLNNFKLHPRALCATRSQYRQYQIDNQCEQRTDSPAWDLCSRLVDSHPEAYNSVTSNAASAERVIISCESNVWRCTPRGGSPSSQAVSRAADRQTGRRGRRVQCRAGGGGRKR